MGGDSVDMAADRQNQSLWLDRRKVLTRSKRPSAPRNKASGLAAR